MSRNAYTHDSVNDTEQQPARDPQQAQSASLLTSVPRELRNQLYTLITSDQGFYRSVPGYKSHRISVHFWFTSLVQPAILSVNHQLQAEALEDIIRKCTLSCTIGSVWRLDAPDMSRASNECEDSVMAYVVPGLRRLVVHVEIRREDLRAVALKDVQGFLNRMVARMRSLQSLVVIATYHEGCLAPRAPGEINDRLTFPGSHEGWRGVEYKSAFSGRYPDREWLQVFVSRRERGMRFGRLVPGLGEVVAAMDEVAPEVKGKLRTVVQWFSPHEAERIFGDV